MTETVFEVGQRVRIKSGPIPGAPAWDGARRLHQGENGTITRIFGGGVRWSIAVLFKGGENLTYHRYEVEQA